LKEPFVVPCDTSAHPSVTEGAGTIIGRYKLLQQIGEGGFGVVYMAEQKEPVKRRVALKIIKLGMDTKEVIARFEAERQALALMDHPHIAKVLDAGTTETGRPYFVMELVKGVSIAEFCDQNQLPARARLELFVPVCQAVQHAHTKGVIHRDLKPSNILVTLHDGKPVPKVIDFGVAKALNQELTEKTLFTAYGHMVGTPQYMSPEQAEMSGLDVDMRSDIYSLGVVLYELLTGTTPLEARKLRSAAYAEMQRLIREEEAPRPSQRVSTLGERLTVVARDRHCNPVQLAQLLRGELDWIVLKALEKDRARRYETANGLARDLQHYLVDEPVEACPPSAGYKLRKFVRKYKAGLATAAAFAVLLMLGMLVSTWQAVRAMQAEAMATANALQAEGKEQEATQQRDDARALAEKLQAALEQLRRTTYAAQMNLAQHAWEKASVGRMRELLDQHRPKAGEPDLRGFEWHYLNRLDHSELLTFHGLTSRVSNMVFSPDGKRLAAGSAGTRDGTQGARVGGEVKVWDAQTGKELLTLKTRSWCVAFSPDGTRLANAGGEGVKVWDAQTGQELLSLQGASWRVAYSPDGKRIASVSNDTTVKVWDAQTGQELLAFKGHTELVYSVAFSPDGKRLVSTGGGAVKVWDAQSGQELLSLKAISYSPQGVAFSPDGKRLASGDSDRATVWDAQTGQELLSLKGRTGWVDGVTFSPDGKRLASGSWLGMLQIWDLQTGQEIRTLKGGGGSVVFSPDGQRLVSTSADNTVKVWDAHKDQENLTLQGAGGPSVAFSPDFRRLASASLDSTVQVRDVQTGQLTLTFKGHTVPVLGVAFSPDGKSLASGGGGHKTVDGWGVSPGDRAELKVWDAQTGQEVLSLPGLTGIVRKVAFSPDGKRLAGAGGRPGQPGGQREAKVTVWDVQTGQELLTLSHTEGLGPLSDVAYSPDGKRLASVRRGGVKVWDAQTGRELLTLKADTSGVAFSPDGKRLASGGSGREAVLRAWDAQTGQELLALKGHTSRVGSIAFSPDGKRLASGGAEGAVKVWDAQTGQELLTLQGGGYGDVAFSPDGTRLASATDGTVTIWDATPLPAKP
jgi:WD40 repeat protein/tRNA A-37 threonylcarbamoyl transferase component Bud32